MSTRVSRLFEALAALASRCPDAVAVEADRHLTFKQLVREAADKAQSLTPDAVVVVALEPSADAVTWMLATFASGAVYVPVDPQDPPARLEFIARNVGATVCVGGAQVKAVGLGASDRPLDAFPDARLVLYTSGTSGRPKGVALPEDGLLNLALNAQSVYGLNASDRVAQLAPPGFDVAVWEVLVTLLNGATLCVPEREEALPGQRLLVFLRDARVSVLSATPSTLAAIPAGALPSLRLVISAGEEAKQGMLDRWITSMCKTLNVYGPTEASVDCLVQPQVELGKKPTLGWPIPGVQAYVMGDRLTSAADGEVGELLLAGDGVALGYVGDELLTSSKFPLVNIAGEVEAKRCYRTGDLVRRLPTGEFDYLARVDGQVKLRGVRLELAEVEKALLETGAIRDGVASLELVGVRQVLVAHVLLEDGKDVQEVQARVAETLPRRILPNAYVSYARFPLTPRGKIDRAVLSETWRSRMTPGSAADDRQLKRVRNLWSALLDVDEVGDEDDFFASGGHSMLAAKLVASVNDLFQSDVKLRDFVAEPTPVGMARRIREAGE